MIEINNFTKYKLSEKKVKAIVEIFLKENKLKNKKLSIALVGEKRIKKLNSEYRAKNTVTDILSFAGDGNFLGELVICPEQIKRQSRIYQNERSARAIEKEFVFILIHGLLHLAGLDDNTDKKRSLMLKKGEEFIKKHHL